jgi:hypothetical protein
MNVKSSKQTYLFQVTWTHKLSQTRELMAAKVRNWIPQHTFFPPLYTKTITEAHPVEPKFILKPRLTASPLSYSFTANRLARCTSSRMWRCVVSHKLFAGGTYCSLASGDKQYFLSLPPLIAGQCQYPFINCHVAVKVTSTWLFCLPGDAVRS